MIATPPKPAETFRVVTVSPISMSLELRAGIDPRSPLYDTILSALPATTAELRVPNRNTDLSKPDFSDLGRDDYDLRLLVWRPSVADNATSAEFHVYPNGICVVIARFDLPASLTSAQLEMRSQEITRNLIDAHASKLNTLLDELASRLPNLMMSIDQGRGPISRDGISWISRALFLKDEQRSSTQGQILIRDWLKETLSPDDAEAIIAGRQNYSMSWVNYLFMEGMDTDPEELIATVRLAQFFFSAQSELNIQTQRAMTEAFLQKDVRQASASLTTAREKMQLLTIQFGVQKSFLRRSRKRQLDQLLAGWEFEELAKNGERMVATSTSKINEIANTRADRSSFVTDLILAGIALLAVIDVSLYLTEYSRQMMSQPALEFNDDRLSWILSIIASIDTDSILLGGAVTILILVGIYAYWKLRK